MDHGRTDVNCMISNLDASRLEIVIFRFLKHLTLVVSNQQKVCCCCCNWGHLTEVSQHFCKVTPVTKKNLPFLTIWNRYVVYYVLSRFYDNDIEYETFLDTYFSVNQLKNEEKIKGFVKNLQWHQRILAQVWKKRLSQFPLMIWSYLFQANY